MSDVTSKEVSKELYKLAKWGNDLKLFWVGTDESGYKLDYLRGSPAIANSYPAYNLSYLLRKLPPFKYNVKGEQGDMMPVRCFVFVWQETAHQWRAGYKYKLLGQRYDDLFIYADTPEDAAAKLCIKLVEQGIIK